METTKKKRTREEVRAAFRETMRKKKERMEDNLRRMEELELQGFFCITKEALRSLVQPLRTSRLIHYPDGRGQNGRTNEFSGHYL